MHGNGFDVKRNLNIDKGSRNIYICIHTYTHIHIMVEDLDSLHYQEKPRFFLGAHRIELAER